MRVIVDGPDAWTFERSKKCGLIHPAYDRSAECGKVYIGRSTGSGLTRKKLRVESNFRSQRMISQETEDNRANGEDANKCLHLGFHNK